MFQIIFVSFGLTMSFPPTSYSRDLAYFEPDIFSFTDSLF